MLKITRQECKQKEAGTSRFVPASVAILAAVSGCRGGHGAFGDRQISSFSKPN